MDRHFKHKNELKIYFKIIIQDINNIIIKNLPFIELGSIINFLWQLKKKLCFQC